VSEPNLGEDTSLSELNHNFSPKEVEENIRRHWERIDVRRLATEKTVSKPPIGYVEGPPTMNGEPHIGHIRGRILKDLWYRFSVLKGLNVVFRAGWDTQGLPVELQAEKELGLKGSKAENLDIVGEEKIVEACKGLIGKYNSRWREADRLLGMSMDYEKAYWTYRDDYIEREWRYLEQAWKKGLLGEGYRVVPYCPSCQCSLSHAEVGQGYETVSDPSLHYKVKVSGQDRFLILWTTMPFTVVTDEMVGVKPDEEYVEAEVGSERWIIASSRLEGLMADLGVEQYRVVDRFAGKSLEGLRYDYPLTNFIPAQGELHQNEKVHTVVAEEFVDVTTGSGLVHLSPANGEEDFEVAKRRGAPVFNPIDDQVRFTREAGVFDGLFVRDADEKVAEILDSEGSLIKIGKIVHEYPTCWRSHHKLIWTARREYFYWVEKLGDLAVDAARNVEYFFGPPKNRFIELIKEKVPWCVSRERVWGAPLPIWVCTSCGEKIGVFNRKEILANAIETPDGPRFELHRPWIDRVKLRCPKCGGVSTREPFVLDTWHNSGAAPYASFTDEEHKQLVPVAFLTEGIDQTRGWAYTLLIEHVILTGKAEAPYHAFLFQGHILDEKGNKMSKSIGNMIEGIDAMKTHPVDIIRYYMTWKASPIDSLNFSFDEMNTRPYQVLSTLHHLHIYFQQNSQYDHFDHDKQTVKWALEQDFLGPQERWILSRLQRVIDTTTRGNDTCRFNESARAIEQFLIDELSQTYIPTTRREIWDDRQETRNRRLAIYAILAHTLKTIDILTHPLSPHLTEHLYQQTFGGKKTILLEQWPTVENIFLNPQLEEEMEMLLKTVSTINSARMKAKIKRRWPLREAVVVFEDADRLKRHLDLIREQANVKEIRLSSDLKGTPVSLKIKPRYDLLGKRLKEKMQTVTQRLAEANVQEIYATLKKKEEVTITVGPEEIRLSPDELVIDYVSADDSYVVAEREGVAVALRTERDTELRAEGNVRDLARRLQALRKERGYNPTDVLNAAYVAGLDQEMRKSLEPHLSDLSYLVRVKRIQLTEEATEGINWADSEIDGKSIQISVE
jgi:isoleucyl-tRNA synthetase